MCLLISQYHPRPLLRNPSERSNGLHQAPHHRRKADARARIIADAAVRRFQCQRSYLRAHAGMRWMDSRSQILRGQRPNASHFAALQAADNNLRMVRWRSPTPPIPPYMHNHLELPDPNTLAGTPRHHRHPRRLHPPQRRRPAGEMARRRPLPDSNPADAPEPIIPQPPSPHRAGVHAIGEPNPFPPPGRLPSAPAPKQKQKPNTKKKTTSEKVPSSLTTIYPLILGPQDLFFRTLVDLHRPLSSLDSWFSKGLAEKNRRWCHLRKIVYTRRTYDTPRWVLSRNA